MAQSNCSFIKEKLVLDSSEFIQSEFQVLRYYNSRGRRHEYNNPWGLDLKKNFCV